MGNPRFLVTRSPNGRGLASRGISFENIRLSARRALTPRHGRMGGTPTREICSTPPLPRRRCLEMAPFSPPGHYQRADENRRVFFWGRRRFNVQQCARLALPTRALLHVFVPCTKVNDTKRLMTEHSC